MKEFKATDKWYKKSAKNESSIEKLVTNNKTQLEVLKTLYKHLNNNIEVYKNHIDK
jgi:hypothetical protein